MNLRGSERANKLSFRRKHHDAARRVGGDVDVARLVQNEAAVTRAERLVARRRLEEIRDDFKLQFGGKSRGREKGERAEEAERDPVRGSAGLVDFHKVELVNGRAHFANRETRRRVDGWKISVILSAVEGPLTIWRGRRRRPAGERCAGSERADFTHRLRPRKVRGPSTPLRAAQDDGWRRLPSRWNVARLTPVFSRRGSSSRRISRAGVWVRFW